MGTCPPWRPRSVACTVATIGTENSAFNVSAAHATVQSWACTTSGRQPSSRAAHCANWWLADAVRATGLCSGSHGSAVSARNTLTPSMTRSAGSSGWARLMTTTSWPARASAVANPSTWVAMPPTTSGGYSHDSINTRTAGR
jgi:hypothetical protein